jgi:hypothetical protein
MSLESVITSIDAEIERLENARTLLAGVGTVTHGKVTTSSTSATKARKRTLSAEGRRHIADAQRKRWAKQKKGK